MGILTWLGSNAGGIIGKKWVMAVIITLFITGLAALGYMQYQKEELREEKAEIMAQLSKEQAQHVAEVERITVKNNQIIKDMINNEDLERLQTQLANLKKKSKISSESKTKLERKLKELENTKNEWLKCEMPQDIKQILNGDKKNDK